MVIKESKRVTRWRVILHCPLEDEEEFSGRIFDYIFQMYHLSRKGCLERNTEEHLTNVEPHLFTLLREGFRIRGVMNAYVWLKIMELQYFGPKYLGVLAAWLYYLLNRIRVYQPVLGAAVAVWDKKTT